MNALFIIINCSDEQLNVLPLYGLLLSEDRVAKKVLGAIDELLETIHNHYEEKHYTEAWRELVGLGAFMRECTVWTSM